MFNHAFFNRSPLVIARQIVGKLLVRKIAKKVEKYVITETEAYLDHRDLASHARFGNKGRSEVMWRKSGTIYVYFCYGVHWMLNIVCERQGKAGAVLIRGIEHASGPGRVTKKLQITKDLNGTMLGRKSGLWIEENYEIKSGKKKFKILKTKRIGIVYAGKWKEKKMRFVMG